MSTDLRFLGDWKLWAAIPAALLLAAAAWGLYWRETRKRSGALSWLLPTLRALSVFLIMMILSGPVLHHRQVVGELARVFLFVDSSRSMQVTDDNLETSRKLMIAQQLGWLPKDTVDAAMVRASDALARAEQQARGARIEMENALLIESARTVVRELETAVEQLKLARSETYPNPVGGALKIQNELVAPARKLSEQTLGNNPHPFVESLSGLADKIAEWERQLRRAFGETAGKMASGNDTAVRTAIDKFNSNTRWQRLEAELLDEADGLAPALAQQHNLEMAAMSGPDAELLWWPGAGSLHEASRMPTTFKVKPEGWSTDLSDAIRTRMEKVKAEERAAVILFTDGRHNAGTSPLQLAKMLGSRNVPIFAVGIGSPVPPADLAVLQVKGPETIFQDARVKGSIEFKDDMPPGQPFTIRIESAGRVVWEKTINTEQKSLRSLPYDFAIKEIVQAELAKQDRDLKFNSVPLDFDVVITPLAGEKDKENNRGSLHLSAITERPRVLLIEGRPRWDFRYLRNLLERDQKWEANVLLAGGGGEMRPLVRGNQNGQFPKDRETLYGYQLIIIGDIPPNLLTSQEMEWIREFVEKRGGGLIFIDGPREKQSRLLGTPLKPLLPVDWKDQPLTGAQLQMRVHSVNNTESPISLVSDPQDNAELWAKLQAPRWAAPAEALPGAEVWIDVVGGGRTVPAIVFHRFGAGRVLYSGIEETWRWRYEVGDLHHQKFWNQAAKWIMEPSFPVQDKYVSIDSGPRRYTPGESADLRVRLRDGQGRLLLKADAEVQLFKDGQRVATTPLTADESAGGVFRGRTAALTEGKYEVRVRVDGLPESEMKARTSFTVQPEGAGEMAITHCDEPFLRQMAALSGGAYFKEEELGALKERLKPLSQGHVEETETVLWQSWWWFVPIIVLLGLEWFLRKRTGMI